MKYMKAMIEAIDMQAEDVILTSGDACDEDLCWTEGLECDYEA